MISRMLSLLLLATGLWRASAAELMVFAAASLTDALKEAGAEFGKKSGLRVRFNFGASSILARQIQEGARADVFFSADEQKMDQLEKRRLIKPGTRTSLLSNSLVVVVEKDSALRFEALEDLKKAKRIAIAEPSTVPAGIYARQTLDQAGLWEMLRARMVPTENVRGALAAVETGNVDAAIIYKTDAAISRKVRVVLQVDSKTRISYPVAVLAETRLADGPEWFVEFLKGAEARAIFEGFGFTVRSEAAATGLNK
jgi:molybdate transport system substrate-binding protein